MIMNSIYLKQSYQAEYVSVNEPGKNLLDMRMRVNGAECDLDKKIGQAFEIAKCAGKELNLTFNW